MINAQSAGVPPEFVHALTSLRTTRLRPEVRLREIPAPARTAPYAVALSADLMIPGQPDEEVADGRFIALFNPQWQEDWQGNFRIVTLVRADLEPEMGDDPMLAEVAWSWLTECLAEHAGAVEALTGTVTRVIDQGFGAAAEQRGDVELEIRASWTPSDSDLSGHLTAWAQLLSSSAGVPPLPPGVSAIR